MKSIVLKMIEYILILNKNNLGLIKSLNIALKVANGDFIARMDADDISYKHRISKQLNYIKENNLDLIGSNVNLFKSNQPPFFTTDKLISHNYLKKMFYYGAIGIVHHLSLVGKKYLILLRIRKCFACARIKSFLLEFL